VDALLGGVGPALRHWFACQVNDGVGAGEYLVSAESSVPCGIGLAVCPASASRSRSLVPIKPLAPVIAMFIADMLVIAILGLR